MTKKVSVLVGSLRRGSYALKTAKNIIKMFPENFDVKIVEIRDLPLYNFDYDTPEETDFPTPKEYIEFRKTISDSDGVFFVTPENNRTIPACLKNAVDICSKADVALKGKPAGVISHSIGKMGGYSSQKNLKLALSYFDMPMLGQPEIFLGNSPTYFDDKGNINAERTAQFLQKYVDRYVDLVNKHT